MPKFYRKVLKNGMTILFEKRDVPIVSVAFATRAGGLNEKLDEKGISHFIEHLLYKGTPKRNSMQIAKEIEEKGGVLNGFTSEEAIAFWCKMPSEYLNVALDVLSDIIKNPLFDEKEIAKERQVIFEEMKLDKDNPMKHAFRKIGECLYEPKDALNVLGTEKTMNSIDRKKIVQKFEEIFTPNNLILCVVGDAKFEELVKFAEKNFDGKKSKIPSIKLKKKNSSKMEKRKGIDQANLVFAHHVPSASDKKNYAAQVLNEIMAGGMSSRLFTEIREKRNLAYAVKGYSDIGNNFAYNLIYVGTTKKNVEGVKKIILKEFEEVSKNISEEELKEIKKQIIGNYKISMESSAEQITHLIFAEIEGDAREFYNFEKNINSVKLNDVKEMAKKAKEKYSFFALVPE